MLTSLAAPVRPIFSPREVAAYLARIGFDGPAEPTLAALHAIYRAHYATVPFENLDIVPLGRPLSLEPAALHDKIVRRRRGGFCYELTGLLAAIPRDLGFAVTVVSVQFVEADGALSPRFDHMALVVAAPDESESWLVDAAGGRHAAAWPLPLRDGFTEFQANVQRGFRLTERDGWWRLNERLSDGEWAPEYAFDLTPRTLADFLPRCRFQENDPDSFFRQGMLCTLPAADGRITLAKDRLIATRGGERVEREVSPAEIDDLLRRHFGVDLSLDEPVAAPGKETLMSLDGSHPAGLAPLHVLGAGGSTRLVSKSRVALATALRLCAEAGATTTMADLRALDLPVYDADRPLDDYPPAVHWLLGEARRADAFIFCSPTYHGTVTGAVKNVLDILDYLIFETVEGPGRTFDGRPVALIGCGGGAQNVINALFHAVRALDGIVIPTVAAISNDAIDADTGDIHSESATNRLRAMTGQLLDLAARLRATEAIGVRR